MEKTAQLRGNSPNKKDTNEEVLFNSWVFDDNNMKETAFDDVMRNIESIFEPSMFIGTVGVWHGRYKAYKFCENTKELREALMGYDDIIIRRIESQLWFTLIHHDGHHEIELRRITDDDFLDWGDLGCEHFDEILRRTEDFYQDN
jgi:hypothetical protein